MADRRVHELYRGLRHGANSRRQFAKSAAALGVSASAIGSFLKAANVAHAQDPLLPPVVAQPCAGDGCLRDFAAEAVASALSATAWPFSPEGTS